MTFSQPAVSCMCYFWWDTHGQYASLYHDGNTHTHTHTYSHSLWASTQTLTETNVLKMLLTETRVFGWHICCFRAHLSTHRYTHVRTHTHTHTHIHTHTDMFVNVSFGTSHYQATPISASLVIFIDNLYEDWTQSSDQCPGSPGGFSKTRPGIPCWWNLNWCCITIH